jgi:hypothetical protein
MSGTTKVSLNYTLPTTAHIKSHIKSSWHSVIPSTADSLNSDLRRLTSLFLIILYSTAPSLGIRLTYTDAARTTHSRKHSSSIVACASVQFPRNRYPVSPLTRWLLPSNGLGADLHKTTVFLTSSIVV